MEIPWPADQFIDEADCRRHGSTRQGKATKAVGSSGSPFGRRPVRRRCIVVVPGNSTRQTSAERIQN